MRRNLIFLLCFVWQLSALAQNNDSIENINDSNFTKWRFGGYGEILYRNMDFGPDRFNYPDGAQADNRSIVDLPRIVFSFEYKFRKDIEFATEIEFEHGGTGSALELEYEEMGEYEMEMEKAGEVVLEQIHFTKTFSPAFKVRIGHMVVPVGLTNSRHLPIEYFGTVRPEGETQIIPLTWHETGLAFLGKIKKWSYEFQLINGLDANGFSSANWIKKGKQSIFENTKATHPAVVGRIENKNVRNLTLGASFYYGGSVANTAKPEKMEHLKGEVGIGTFDFEFDNRKFIARGNIIYGNLGESAEISRINQSISKNIQYPRTPVAKNGLTYSIETGYNFLPRYSKEKLFAFARYEYYNTMEETSGNIFADARFKRDVVTVGMNYHLLPSLALKLDYSRRMIDKGNYNNENTIGFALVYAGWFASK